MSQKPARVPRLTGLDLFAERDHGDILARVVGMLEIAGVAAVVGGDDDAVVVSELCKQAPAARCQIRAAPARSRPGSGGGRRAYRNQRDSRSTGR